MAGDKESKTEKPTPKKLKEARDEGQIARSQDLVAWISIFATFSILQSSVGRMAEMLSKSMQTMSDLIAHPDMNLGLKFAIDSIRDGFLAVAPLMLGFAAVATLSHFAQVRFILTLKAMKPSFKKLDPIAGTKRLFSPQSLFTASKQAVIAVILGYVAYRTLYDTMMGVAQNGPYSIAVLVKVTTGAVISFVKQAAFVGLIIGLIDYGYMYKKTAKNMMMTKEEVKQESKNQEGSGEIKGKIRQKQRQMSRNRMMSAIQDADVVVVNPVHIAVALKYNPVIGAPKVVAKGAGFVAEKIREKADDHNVPLIQDIPLARTLHKACDVDDEIPAELFEAVAHLLAFVFALRNRGTASGYHKMPGSPELNETDRIAKREAELALSPA